MTDEMSSNSVSVALFLTVVSSTLALTYWAARRTQSRQDFYVARGSLSGWQNGLAIAGDFVSASTILGIPALMLAGRADAIVYVVSTMIGLALTLLLIVEPLRKLGRFSVAEVIALRYDGRSVRALTAVISLIISVLYLLAQMVAAGGLIQILFGIPYGFGVAIVAVLMLIYVTFGGMVATTWVQIIKACVMICGVVILSFSTLRHVDFDLPVLYAGAAENLTASAQGDSASLEIGSLFSIFSIAFALALGIPGLPHLLMRVFTVRDPLAARRSMVIGMCVNGFIATLVLLVLSYGALAFVLGKEALLDSTGQLAGGANMAVVHLARVVGGDALFGFMAAMLFATILAVVSGLTLVSASALAHDLYAQTYRRGQVSEKAELRVFRLGALSVTGTAVILALIFRGQNVTFLVGLAFSVAASASFPLLLLALYWKGLTKRGALMSATAGLVTSVGLIVLGPTVWVAVLHHAQPIYPSAYPTLISMPLAFVAAWLVSTADKLGRRANLLGRSS